MNRMLVHHNIFYRVSLYALTLFAFFFAFPVNHIALAASLNGFVDGIGTEYGQYYLGGWACAVGQPGPINVELYVGGPPGTGTQIGTTYPANITSESGVAAACNSTGTNYRYMILLSASTVAAYGGKPIYVVGVSADGQTTGVLSQSGKFNVPTNPVSGAGLLTLTATPNPCIANPGSLCSTILNWNAGAVAQIWVQVDGQSNGSLLACGTGGATPVSWIQPNHVYSFSLYQASSCDPAGRIGSPIDLVSVRGVPFISGSPASCPATQAGVCTATINWNNYSLAQVWVQVDGQTNSTLFACGVSGAQQAPWIRPGHTYSFSVYQASSCASSGRTGAALGSFSVQGTASNAVVNLTAISQGGPDGYSITVAGTGITPGSTVAVRRRYSSSYANAAPYITLTEDWKVLNTYPNNVSQVVVDTSNANSQSLTFALATDEERTEFTLWGLIVTVENNAGVWSSIYIPPRTPDSPFSTDPLRSWGVELYELPDQLIQTNLHYQSTQNNTATYPQAVASANMLLAMNRKAVADAYYKGAKNISVFVPGFRPIAPTDLQAGVGWNDLVLWQSNPDLYWQKFDGVAAAVQRYGMSLNLRGWNDIQMFTALVSVNPASYLETWTNFMQNPNSKSFQLFEAYWGQLLTRYKDNPSIFMVDAPNEMNLGADLDLVTRCKQRWAGNANVQGLCATAGNYSSADLITFGQNLVAFFHSVDPNRKVGSGYALPRLDQYHLSLQPEWSPKGPDWTFDTPAQYVNMFVSTNMPYDIFDVHAYNSVTENIDGVSVSGLLQSLYGDQSIDPASAANMSLVTNAVQNLPGKSLFVGEFGDTDPATEPTEQFSKNLIQWGTQNQNLGGSLWGYETFQNTYMWAQPLPFQLEPGTHDDLMQVMAVNNRNLGQAIYTPAVPDKVPPQILITWPLDGSTVSSGQLVHIEASDDAGPVKEIDVTLGSGTNYKLTTWPFEFNLVAKDLPAAGITESLTAIAYDMAGNAASDTISITSSGK